MKPIVSISIGLVYKFYQDRNEAIQLFKTFSPDGIEIHHADPEILFNFKVSKENVDYLQSLKHVSIHAPWKDITYGMSEQSRRVLTALRELCQIIDVKVIVIDGQIEDVSIFREFPDLPLAIENEDWRKENGLRFPSEARKFLEENDGWGMVLDIAHAMTVGGTELVDDFIEQCGPSIVQIHAAMQDRTMTDHAFLHKYDSKEIRAMITKLKKLNIPFVLEAVATTQDEITNVTNEINHIKHI